MKKIKAYTIIFLSGVVLTSLFMNCSEHSSVSFSTQQSFEENPNVGDQDLIDQLPDEEKDLIRPIDDIVDNPDLRDIYKCPSNPDGILICHFPSSDGSQHTLCVGGNAPKKHSEHQVVYDEFGNIVELSDYLGPCKPN